MKNTVLDVLDLVFILSIIFILLKIIVVPPTTPNRSYEKDYDNIHNFKPKQLNPLIIDYKKYIKKEKTK